ncbi:MAG TPA: glycosyltransferase family 4 protein, partial [Spongiibacteraceae bacterium]|nr:glycosyltransferase family 4 protein [Spongiibacteraceae bacterium]
IFLLPTIKTPRFPQEPNSGTGCGVNTLKKLVRLAVVTYYPAEVNQIQGGVESVTIALIKGLKELASFDIHVVSPAPPGRQGSEQRDGVTIHWINSCNLPGFIRYWTTERYAIHRCLRKIRPDITHFQGVLGWALGYRKPYVVTIHGIAEKDALFTTAPFPKMRYAIISRIEKIVRKKAPHVIVINPYVLTELAGQIGGQPWHIENPVDGEFFDTRRAVDDKRILYVGRIIPLKNIIGLIESFNYLLKKIPNATLYLTGGNDVKQYLAECQKKVNDYGIASSVFFLGNIKHNELPKILATANCLVLLSHQENAPMAIAEAMAAGVPVVASNICGIPYMIESGATGFLVDPNDSSRAAAALEQILGNNNLAETMSAKCRDVAETRFHYRSVAHRTKAVYESAMGLTPGTETSPMEVADHVE